MRVFVDDFSIILRYGFIV